MPFWDYYGILELNGLIMSLLGKLNQGEYEIGEERGGWGEEEENKKEEKEEEEEEKD